MQWHFDNLLPEETLRVVLAKDAKIEGEDAFGLLAYFDAESVGSSTTVDYPLMTGRSSAKGDNGLSIDRVRCYRPNAFRPLRRKQRDAGNSFPCNKKSSSVLVRNLYTVTHPLAFLGHLFIKPSSNHHPALMSSVLA